VPELPLSTRAYEHQCWSIHQDSRGYMTDDDSFVFRSVFPGKNRRAASLNSADLHLRRADSREGTSREWGKRD
jgi:hypothetical protein